MRQFLANVCAYTVCRWFGHGKLIIGEPLFKPWPGTERLRFWMKGPKTKYPVQCSRCWQVVGECDYVTVKGPIRG